VERGQEATQPDHLPPSPLAGEGSGERGQSPGPYDAILAVAHRDFITMGPAALRALGKPKCVLYDVKAALPADQVDGRL
jgi:hypothetical protein